MVGVLCYTAALHIRLQADMLSSSHGADKLHHVLTVHIPVRPALQRLRQVRTESSLSKAVDALLCRKPHPVWVV